MRLLIVDDDVPTVETVWDSIAWRDIGISEVEIAHSVAQAKAVIEREPVDIVISDIEMPQGSGLDLLAWIRGRGDETEFILLTCHERFDYAAHAIKLDAAEYLVQGIDTVAFDDEIDSGVHRAMKIEVDVAVLLVAQRDALVTHVVRL